MRSETATCDVVVVGGGIGGVAAAMRVAEGGARVTLLEAGERLGGTALFSGGSVHIWGARTWEEFKSAHPHAPPLFRVVVENYMPFVEWLTASGAPGEFGHRGVRGWPLPLTLYKIAQGFHAPDAKVDWFRYLGARIESLGGTVSTKHRVTSATRVDDAFVVAAEGPNGVMRLRAPVLVLATGGFQRNPQMLAELLDAPADRFATRAAPLNVGDGLTLGASLGGAMSSPSRTVYGHLMPAAPCEISWSNFVDPALLSGWYAQHSIVLNVRGERFVDEGPGEHNGETINTAIRQPTGSLWILYDERLRRDAVAFHLPQTVLTRRNLRYLWLLKFVRLRRDGNGIRAIVDGTAFARARGATVLAASSLERLASELEAHGVDGVRALATIREFNDHVSSGRAAELPIPRTTDAHALERAPFYAIKVGVGVSMTYDGLAIDDRGRVQDESGTPVAGLFAVPGTAGGVHELNYGGALASSGVFGMVAGMQIQEELRARAARSDMSTDTPFTYS